MDVREFRLEISAIQLHCEVNGDAEAREQKM